MKESKYYKTLPVILTQEEFDTKSTALADLCKEINFAKLRQKEDAKNAKDAIDKQETDRMMLASIVKDRAEERSVECEDRYNFRERIVESVRLDTGEIIGTRAMNVTEYQQEMDLHANVATAVPFAKLAKG